jgi:hypothetical protein
MEQILKDRQQQNSEAEIWPTENAVINRLLSASVDMEQVYKEVSSRLSQPQMENFWDAMLGVACFWTPSDSMSLREVRRDLVQMNRQIETHAHKIVALLRRRSELAEEFGFRASSDYHVLSLLDRAGDARYELYVRPELRKLRGRYDLKYWPDIPSLVESIAVSAKESEVFPVDDWTQTLLSSRKGSRTDYLRVILQAIEERKEDWNEAGRLPSDFRMSDKSLAIFITHSLDSFNEEPITAEYVKNARMHIRNNSV